MPLPFWKFFIRYIEQWTKTFCKKKQSTGRSTGDDFEIYRSSRVEKILISSISAVVYCEQAATYHKQKNNYTKFYQVVQ